MGHWAWFLILWPASAILLGDQLYGLMVEAPWGLRPQGDFTVESNLAAYLLIALITAAAAWAVTRPGRSSRGI